LYFIQQRRKRKTTSVYIMLVYFSMVISFNCFDSIRVTHCITALNMTTPYYIRDDSVCQSARIDSLRTVEFDLYLILNSDLCDHQIDKQQRWRARRHRNCTVHYYCARWVLLMASAFRMRNRSVIKQSNEKKTISRPCCVWTWKQKQNNIIVKFKRVPPPLNDVFRCSLLFVFIALYLYVVKRSRDEHCNRNSAETCEVDRSSAVLTRTIPLCIYRYIYIYIYRYIPDEKITIIVGKKNVKTFLSSRADTRL